MSEQLLARYARREVRETGSGRAMRYGLYAVNAVVAVSVGGLAWRHGALPAALIATLFFAPALIGFAVFGSHAGKLQQLRSGPIAIAKVVEHVRMSHRHGSSTWAKLTCTADGHERTAVFALHPLPPVGTEVPVVYFKNSLGRLEPLTHRGDFVVTPLG